MTASPAARQALPPITAVTSAIVRWTHRRGGRAHCLVRLRMFPTSDAVPPVEPTADRAERGRFATTAVVSELRNNPRGREITSDFAGLAMTALSELIPTACPPETISWYAHHGPFSTYDHTDEPETLTRVALRWDGQGYLSPDPTDYRLLPPGEAGEVISLLRLEPVGQVLAAWSWEGPSAPSASSTIG
jgi:hypothetical protein